MFCLHSPFAEHRVEPSLGCDERLVSSAASRLRASLFRGAHTLTMTEGQGSVRVAFAAGPRCKLRFRMQMNSAFSRSVPWDESGEMTTLGGPGSEVFRAPSSDGERDVAVRLWCGTSRAE